MIIEISNVIYRSANVCKNALPISKTSYQKLAPPIKISKHFWIHFYLLCQSCLTLLYCTRLLIVFPLSVFPSSYMQLSGLQGTRELLYKYTHHCQTPEVLSDWRRLGSMAQQITMSDTRLSNMAAQ